MFTLFIETEVVQQNIESAAHRGLNFFNAFLACMRVPHFAGDIQIKSHHGMKKSCVIVSKVSKTFPLVSRGAVDRHGLLHVSHLSYVELRDHFSGTFQSPYHIILNFQICFWKKKNIVVIYNAR
jgi:hypothetical protein